MPQWAMSALTRVPAACPAPGWTTSSGRLVDDDQRVILIDQFERNGLAARLWRRGRRQIDRKAFARFDPVFHVHYGRPVQRDATLFDQVLHAGAAQLGQALAQEPVEPHSFVARLGFGAKTREGGSFL